MDTNLKRSLWQQFGAAIDTLADALRLCPDHLWEIQLWEDEDDARYGQFWWIAYHTLIWTDMYLYEGESYQDFKPPAPFVRGEFPLEPYTKEEINLYLAYCRDKVKSMAESLTDEKASRVCIFSWMTPTFLELQFYSMRHVQEHAAQLNLVLGQQGITGQDWVAKAREDIE